MENRTIKIIVASAVLVIVLSVAAAIFLISGFLRPFIDSPRNVDAEIAKLRARGKPVAPEDLAPAPIPASQNAAVVYNEIFRLMHTRISEADQEKIGEFVNPRSGVRGVKLWEDVRHIVERNRDLVGKVQAAVARPRCYFTLDWSKGADMPLPCQPEMRRLAQLITAAAIVRAKSGDMGGAVRALVLAFRTSEDISEQPLLGPQLVGVAIVSMASRASNDVLNHGGLTETEGDELFRALGEIDISSNWKKALEGERAMGISVFEHYRGTHVRNKRNDPNSVYERIDKSEVADFMEGRDELRYLVLTDRQIKAFHLPWRDKRTPRSDEHVRCRLPGDPFLTAILMVPSSRSRATRDIAIAQLAGVRTLVALRVYHDRYDRYPQTLTDLRDKLGWKLPQDIFSGKDLIYKPQGHGFILYSIGPDLTDSGGVPQKKQGRYDSRGDIVWKLDH